MNFMYFIYRTELKGDSMFKSIPNSPMDSTEQIRQRMSTYCDVFTQGLHAGNGVELATNYLKSAKKQAEFVDQVLSKILTGEDLMEYARRMKYIAQHIQQLERSLKVFGKTRARTYRIPVCVGAMAYLEGELKGLTHTVQEYQEEKASQTEAPQS